MTRFARQLWLRRGASSRDSGGGGGGMGMRVGATRSERRSTGPPLPPAIRVFSWCVFDESDEDRHDDDDPFLREGCKIFRSSLVRVLYLQKCCRLGRREGSGFDPPDDPAAAKQPRKLVLGPQCGLPRGKKRIRPVPFDVDDGRSVCRSREKRSLERRKSNRSIIILSHVEGSGAQTYFPQSWCAAPDESVRFQFLENESLQNSKCRMPWCVI